MLSFEDLQSKVRAALEAKYPRREGEWERGPFLEATTDQAVIVRLDGKLWRLPYTLSDTQDLSLGEAALVEIEYEPVSEAVGLGRSLDRTGAAWEVRVLRLGASRNGWLWTRESAEQLLPHLEGAAIAAYAYRNGVTAHAQPEAVLAAAGPVTRNVVGHLERPRLEADGVYAEAHVHEDAAWLRRKLLHLEQRGVLDRTLGLSVDSLAGFVPVRVREGVARWITAIKRVLSVDIVTTPSADGRFIRATAGPLLIDDEEDGMTRQELIALIQKHRPQLLEGRVTESLTDQDLGGLLAQALAPPPTAAAAATPEPPEWARTLRQDFELGRSQVRVTEALAGSQLPAPVQDKLRKQFTGRVVEPADLEQAITAERETLARLSESGDVRGFGRGRSEVLVAPRDKIQAAVDRLFGVSPASWARVAEARPFLAAETLTRVAEALAPPAEAHKDRGLDFGGSLRRAYVELTGDVDISGRVGLARASEAITSSTWADILGNTLYRRLLQDYAEVQYHERAIAIFGRAQDFRTKESIIQGYFGDLSDVDPEAANYTEIAAIGDDKVSYAVGQKGNILTITRKTIINDDLAAVQRAVSRLGRAARRTLARFIWNFWVSNSVFDVDGLAWFHATHANTGATALTANLTGATEVLAKIIQLADMTEPGSAEKLGLPPLGSLWLDVPHALYGVAMQINDSLEFGAGNVNPVYKRFGEQGERINVNPLFTDATDWGVHVAPGAGGRESIQVDFLNGREEPEFFLADQPTVGETFLGDRIQYKIRHEYGGDIQDFRGATKNVVAG